jgi:hypothetical protein
VTVKMMIIMSLLLSPAETTALDFGVMFGLFLLVALVTVWWFFGRKGRRRRKRKHHHSRRHSRRADAGGLPPVRQPEDQSGLPPKV